MSSRLMKSVRHNYDWGTSMHVHENKTNMDASHQQSVVQGN